MLNIPEISNSQSFSDQNGLTASAVLFNEDHPRSFKNIQKIYKVKTSQPITTKNERNPRKTISPSHIIGERYEDKKIISQEEQLETVKRALSGDQNCRKGIYVNTFSSNQRELHLCDPTNYNEINYEQRIKQLTKSKISKSSLSSKVIEKWLNDILTEACNLSLPGIIIKPERQQPLSRYGMDKNQLADYGISHTSSDRIYRGLFVYSMGFYEMLSKEIETSSSFHKVQSIIWKVFATLLEYCCRTDYSTMIIKMQERHKQEIETAEEDFNSFQEKMAIQDAEMKQRYEKIQIERDSLIKELNQLKFEYQKTNDIMQSQGKSFEEEVNLRLQFESKLNSLHALNRKYKSQFERALEDILILEKVDKEKTIELERHRNELIGLRAYKLDSEQQIKNLKDKQAQNQAEIDSKIRVINDLDQRIITLNDTVDKKDYLLKDQEQIFNTLKLKNEALEAAVRGHESENKHLDLSLKELKVLKEQYFTRNEELQKNFQELLEKYNQTKSELIGTNEIKKDRDERIDSLRTELDSTSKNYDELSKANAGLAVQYTHLMKEHNTLKEDYEKLISNLHIANDARQKTEESLSKKEVDNKLLLQKLNNVQEQNETLRQEYIHLQDKLRRGEITIDELETRLDSEKRTGETQKVYLTQKWKDCEVLLVNEKEAREQWIKKYEDEQKMHLTTNQDLLKIRSQFQETNFQLNNNIVQLEQYRLVKDTLQEEFNKLQLENSHLKALNENFDREIFSKKRLLKTVEDQSKEMQQQQTQDFKKKEDEFNQKLMNQYMMFEDLRSFCVDKNLHIQSLTAEISRLNNRIANNEQQIDKQTKRLEQLDQELFAERKQNDELNSILKDANSKIDKQSNKIKQLEEEIENLKSEKNRLEEENKQIQVLTTRLEEAEVMKQEMIHQIGDLNEIIQANNRPRDEQEIQAVVESQEQEVQTEELSPEVQDSQGFQRSDMVQQNTQQSQFQNSSLQQQQFQNAQIQQQQFQNFAIQQQQFQYPNNQFQNPQIQNFVQNSQNQMTQFVNQQNQLINQQILGENQPNYLLQNQNISSPQQSSVVNQLLIQNQVQDNRYGKGQNMRIKSAANVGNYVQQSFPIYNQELISSQSTGQTQGVHFAASSRQMQTNNFNENVQSLTSSGQGNIFSPNSMNLISMKRNLNQEREVKSVEGNRWRNNGQLPNLQSQQNNDSNSSFANINQLLSASGGFTSIPEMVGNQIMFTGQSHEQQEQQLFQNTMLLHTFNNAQKNSSQDQFSNRLLGTLQSVQRVSGPPIFKNHNPSKKSFRIRGNIEKEYMKMYGSHNNFNEMFPQEMSDPDLKESVIQLKKSHAALVTKTGMNFPHSQQRRNIQTAVARKPKQMLFGGKLVPTGSVEYKEGAFKNFGTNQILEIDENAQDENSQKNRELSNNDALSKDSKLRNQMQLNNTSNEKTQLEKGFVSPNDSRNSAYGAKNIETIKREESPQIKKNHVLSETNLSIELDSKPLKKSLLSFDENYPATTQNKSKPSKGGKTLIGKHPTRIDGFSVSGNSINMLGNETVGLGINKFKIDNYSGADLHNPGIKIIASVNKMRINLPNTDEGKSKKDPKAQTQQIRNLIKIANSSNN